MPADVVLASNNRGKLEELCALLPPWVRVQTAAELSVELPEESGQTFAENALLKARAAAGQTGLVAVADDSGLEVDALRGLPGVRSARFAGEPSSDAANNALLLERLAGVPAPERGARFRSIVAVVTPEGDEWLAEGSVGGYIVLAPRGANGFGYDPLFVPEGRDRTMAELTLEEKNRISHRARAFEQAARRLVPFLERRRTDSDRTS